MMGSIRTFPATSSDTAEEESWIAGLMDSAMEGLCKPLKVIFVIWKLGVSSLTPTQLRTIQTIQYQDGSVTAYKISNLLQFYSTTMGRTIGGDALLTKTLLEFVV